MVFTKFNSTKEKASLPTLPDTLTSWLNYFEETTTGVRSETNFLPPI